MSNDYATKLLVDQRFVEFHHEADQDRLFRLIRADQPYHRRWWERLMLFRSGTRIGAATTLPSVP